MEASVVMGGVEHRFWVQLVVNEDKILGPPKEVRCMINGTESKLVLSSPVTSLLATAKYEWVEEI